MPENFLPLTFQKGLREDQEDSVLTTDSLSALENWVPEPSGVLRCRRGWNLGPTTGQPATQRVRGIGYFGTVGRLLTASELGIYSTPDTLTGAWNNPDAVTGATDRMVPFAAGLGRVFYSGTTGAVRQWDGVAAAGAAITGAPDGARSLAFHENRVWVGGYTGSGSVLRHSALGDYASWPVDSFDEIGQGEGQIEDIAPFADGLVIAKNVAPLYFMGGKSEETFSFDRLNAGKGMAGRCICVTPYGAVVAAKKQVWLWTGGGVNVISRPIEDSYEITGNYVSTAFVDDVLRVCDELTGTIWALNMQVGSWWQEKTDSHRPGVVFAVDDLLTYGPRDSTTGLLRYRREPKGTRSRDAGTAETFRAVTPEIWPEPSGFTVTPRHLYIRYKQRGGVAADQPLVLTSYFGGVALPTKTLPLKAGAGTYRHRFDIGSNDVGKGIGSVKFELAQTVPDGQSALIDIEELLLGYDKEDRR